MNIDSYTKIGNSHKVCEDYVVYGSDYVILCDGCSSSPNTDVGARILAHCAAKILDDPDRKAEFSISEVILNAKEVVDGLGLSTRCLDATLLIANIMSTYAFISIYGDGNLIKVDNNDNVQVCNHKFNNNAPYYASYHLEEERLSRYRNDGNGKRTIKVRFLGDGWNSDYYGLESLGHKTLYTVNEVKKIFLASDGIESFYYPNGDPVDLLDVVKEIVTPPVSKGEFVQRIMGSRRGVINTFDKIGIKHYDDISIAGISFDENDYTMARISFGDK
jgi:hypothetical protein